MLLALAMTSVLNVSYLESRSVQSALKTDKCVYDSQNGPKKLSAERRPTHTLSIRHVVAEHGQKTVVFTVKLSPAVDV